MFADVWNFELQTIYLNVYWMYNVQFSNMVMCTVYLRIIFATLCTWGFFNLRDYGIE